jgi:hypothetical protein
MSPKLEKICILKWEIHLLWVHFFKDLSSLDFLLVTMAYISDWLLYAKYTTRQFIYITSLNHLKYLMGSGGNQYHPHFMNVDWGLGNA